MQYLSFWRGTSSIDMPLMYWSLTKITETTFEKYHILCVSTAQDIHSLLCLNATESHLALSICKNSSTKTGQRSIESTIQV